MSFYILGGFYLKSVEFGEEQLRKISEIGKELFNDEQDPRSIAYVRKLERPHINWFKICLCILLPIVLLTTLVLVLKYFGLETSTCLIIATALWVMYITLALKQSIICLIRIYQRYAPESLRNKCRFEPSCSEYMLLAIEKYGLIRGLQKGIRRLKRCNIDGGGFDFP